MVGGSAQSAANGAPLTEAVLRRNKIADRRADPILRTIINFNNY